MFIAVPFTTVKTWKQPICSSTEYWIKKLWYIHTMKYYSAIKRNAFESVLMRWTNPETIIQSEVSHKEKDKYHTRTHVYGIWRDGTDEFIFRAAMEKQTYGHGEGEEREGRCMERVTWKLDSTICKIREPVRICCMSQGTQTGARWQAEGWDGERDGREVREEGTWCTYGSSCWCMTENHKIL